MLLDLHLLNLRNLDQINRLVFDVRIATVIMLRPVEQLDLCEADMVDCLTTSLGLLALT